MSLPDKPETNAPSMIARMLPHAAPADPTSRALLVAARRMAIHGLHDASAALLMVQNFGLHFRKVLVLLRSFMLESSQSAQGAIMIAPCCAPRMTAQEYALIGAITCAGADPALASQYLHQLTGAAHCDGLLATARMLAGAIAESGQAPPQRI